MSSTDKERRDLMSCGEIVEELTKAASGGLPTMSSKEKLKWMFRLKELGKVLAGLPADEDKEAVASDLCVVEECLLDPVLSEPNPLAPLPLNEYSYHGESRRGVKGHAIGLRGRRHKAKKGSRIHCFPGCAKSPIEVVQQQEDTKKHFEKRITTFEDLYSTLNEVQFGTHPLLQYGADIYDVLVLSETKSVPLDTEPSLPKVNELKGWCETKIKLAPSLPSKTRDTPDPESLNSGKCPRPLAPTVPKPKQTPKSTLRQDHILLGNNIMIDEEQLKRDIKKELPNVCCVDIEHKEDVNCPGSFSAVLVFTYADTPRNEGGCDTRTKVRVLTDKESKKRETSDPKAHSINVGKEVTRPKAAPSTLHHSAQYDPPELLKATRLLSSNSPATIPPIITSTKQASQSTCRGGHTKVELMAYLVISVVFVVPFCVFWCWMYTFL